MVPAGSSVGSLYQKLYIQSKSAPDDDRICRPKHVRAELKILIKEKVVASCWLFTSLLYQGIVIVCLVVGGRHTKNFSHPLALSSCYKVYRV